MKKEDLIDELQSILIRTEETMGICLGHAPDNFYHFGVIGEKVIDMDKAQKSFNIAKEAQEDLHALIQRLKFEK